MTEQELKEIEAREKDATPGPWKCAEFSETDDGSVRDANGEDVFTVYKNFKFIAHARTDNPKLTAEVRRLRKGIRLAQEAIKFNAEETVWFNYDVDTVYDFLESLLDGSLE